MSTTTTTVDQLADQLEEVRFALTPLLETLKGLVDGRDRLIAVPLGEFDATVEVEDGVARTTADGNTYVVLPTFAEIEGSRAFLELARIHDLVDACEAHGGAASRLRDGARRHT